MFVCAPPRRLLRLCTLLLLIVLVFIPIPAQIYALSTTITRVSVSTNGAQANGASDEGGFFAAEGLIAFQSDADNLVPNDSNGVTDAFVRDTISGTTTLVSVSSTGEQGNNVSYISAITPDGRWVVLTSFATNLAPGDSAEFQDVFLHDRQQGQTTLVSVAVDGVAANGHSFDTDISADGRWIALDSDATNLCPGIPDMDNNGDIFVHDRLTGTTTCVSLNSNGEMDNGQAWNPSISADGRFVVFTSDADNLFHGDANNDYDVFVHDRHSGQTRLVSVALDGGVGNQQSLQGAISANGRYVTFVSRATNLVPDDLFAQDIFVHDLHTRTTARLTSPVFTGTGIYDSHLPHLSANGRFVVFRSHLTNLVPNDTVICPDSLDFDVNCPDVFLYDRAAPADQTITRVSETPAGVAANHESTHPTISADGRHLLFSSWASDLVADDTNGEPDVFWIDRGISTPMMTVSGAITTTSGMTLTGVVVMVDGFSVWAGDDGEFVQKYLSPEPYTVIPVRTGYLFEPYQRIVTPSATAQSQASADEVLSFTAYPAETLFLPALQQ